MARKRMREERTDLGREVEEALNEVLAHVRREITLPARIADDPSRTRIVLARRKLGSSRGKFAERTK